MSVLKRCLVLSSFFGVNASFNISYQSYPDSGLSICIGNILSTIREIKNFTTDVSLTVNENFEIQHLHGIRRLRYNVRTQSWTSTKIPNTVYIMNFKDYNDMIIGFNVIMNMQYWTPISHFIVILEDENDLDKVTKFLVTYNLYHAIILKRLKSEYNIYTFHSPIPACKHQPYLVKLSKCSMFNRISFKFPMVGSLRGCQFKLTANNVYPMINLDSRTLPGWEQWMMHIFEQKHDMTIELVPYSKIDKFGRIVGNFTSVDMMRLVKAGLVEGAIGGYFAVVKALRHYSLGYPIISDHMIPIMPKAEFYETWVAVFHRSYFVLILVFSLIILFSILAYSFALFPSREADPIRDFLIVFGYFLNKVTERKMRPRFPKSLIISSLLFSVFIIPYSIYAFMYSVETHPMRGYESHQYSEIRDKYQLIVLREWENNEYALNGIKCRNRLHCLNLIMSRKDKMHYTIMERQAYDIYKWMTVDKQCNLGVYRIRASLETMMRTVYFRHGSVLVEPYNKFILDFAANGLLQKYNDYLIFRERVKCKFHAKPTAQALTLRDMNLSFTVLISGYCLSLFCFLYEVVTKSR